MIAKSITDKNNILTESIQYAPTHDTHSLIEEDIRYRYPGVPPPYHLAWARSDESAGINTERNTALSKAATALETAAATCKVLASKTTSMTYIELTEHRNKLAEAVHRGEDQLAELRYMYPMPANHWYSNSPLQDGLREFTPSLLTNTEDRILFWMPPLPAKSLRTNNLIFTEFTDLLHTHDFPHLGQWHCDFFHAHKEGNLTGVRDVDNYPYKPIIDALSNAFFAKDSYDNFSCAMYNISSNRLHPGCYIDVHKRNQKVRILTDFEEYAASLL